MKVLTVCPTKNRLDSLKSMVRSFHATKQMHNDLVLGVNIDDVNIGEYKAIAPMVICKANATVPQIVNDIVNRSLGYDFYHLISDDAKYITQGWDKKFADMADAYGAGLFYGNDLFQGKNLPTFPFFSKQFIQGLGYVINPRLKHGYYGDNMWKVIAQRLDCLYYLDGVIIEHRHFLAGKGEDTTNKAIYDYDREVFAKWLLTAESDVERVRCSIAT